MKRVLAVVMLALMIGACQQKEQPKPQAPQASGQLQSDPKVLQDIVAKDPGNVKAWIQLGNMLMDTGRFGEAAEAYQKAIAIEPTNVDVRVDLGTCLRNVGKSDLAVKEYRKALELNPNHPNGRKNLGVVLAYDLKEYPQAVKEFEAYLQIMPNAPDAASVRNEVQRLKMMK